MEKITMFVVLSTKKHFGFVNSNYGRLALLLLGLSALLPAQNVAIGRYPIPSLEGGPSGITAGPDGALWFTEHQGRIGRITTAGAFTEYPLPTQASGPGSITAGPDGALWFIENYDLVQQIGRITTAGVITEYPLPAVSNPYQITAGPDGALWFTESGLDSIGRITTAGVIAQYPIPKSNSGPEGIALGSDGALWFIEYNVNQIGRITTAGIITEYPLPSPEAFPTGIGAGPDGALWFGASSGSSGVIERITTAGTFSQYPLPSGEFAGAITAGSDGALWFLSGSLVNQGIGRMTLAGAVTIYPVNTPEGPELDGMALGPDGDLWFTDSSDNSIGQVVLVTAGLTVTPSTASFDTTLTFSGSAFAPGETVNIFASGVGSSVIASATADSGGSFTATGAQPASVYGPRIFLGLGQSSGGLGAANYSVVPRLIFSPNSGTAGSRAVVKGTGFLPVSKVGIYWDSPRTLLGKIKVNANGGVTLPFTVPAGTTTGRHLIFGNEAISVGTAQGGGFFYVVP